jgi:predicted DNA binding CopG/RHH family protein
MTTKPEAIPKFSSEDEERDFWAKHSPLDFLDTKTARRVSMPNLKPSMKSISIRLPESLIEELKILANKKDIPYQSLAKIYLAREVAMERREARAAVAEKPERYRFRKKG